MRRRRRSAAVLFGGLVIAALLFIAGGNKGLDLILEPAADMTIDFASLRKGPRPNQYLVCPPGFCAEPPDRPAPEFAVSAATLRDRWQTMIASQPRTRDTDRNPEALQYDYVQRSFLFRFPDTITVRFIPLSSDRATLAVYSRSRYGHSDLGVNRARIEAWLAALADD